MTKEILIRAEGDRFVHDNRAIPKHNTRGLTLTKEARVSDERTIDLSVSSDTPYKRWWYYEILEHTKDAVVLDRMNDGAMNLFNHNRNDYLGIIEKAWLDGGKLYNTVKFGSHQRAEEIVKSINEGIIKNVSIGYRVDELVLYKKSDDDLNTYKATKWTPFESSFVTVPADATVGVGRQYFDFGREKIEIVGQIGQRVSTEVELSTEEREISAIEDNKKTELTVMPDTPTVDIEKERQQERERTKNILAGGKMWNCPDLAEKAVDENWSVEVFHSEVLKRQGQQQPEQKPVAAVTPVGMSPKERKDYRVLRAIGYAAGHLKAEDCGLEIEVSKEIQKRNGKAPKGIYIDQSELVSYRAPYETGVPAAAGNLIETELLSDRFIEQLYNQSAFLPMGVTYLRDLTGNLEIPREATYTTGYWVGEKQTIPEGEGTFDKITMSPKKLAARTKMTYEMTEQASIDLERLARQRLLRGLALELDRTIGFGSGVGFEPLGIVSHPETKSIVLGANGAALSWADLISMQAELFDNNVMGSFGYVLNSRTKAKLQTTLDQPTGGGSWLWRTLTQGDGEIAGYSARCSNQIPNNLAKGTATDLTAIFFGDFSQVMLGLWSGMDVLADPYSEFNEAIIQVRAMQLVDLQLTRGDYFCVATDVQNN